MKEHKRCCNSLCFKESDECEGNVNVIDEENDYWIHSCEKYSIDYLSALEKEIEDNDKTKNNNN